MFQIKRVHVKIQILATEKPEDLAILLHFPTCINDFKSSGLFFFFSFPQMEQANSSLEISLFSSTLKTHHSLSLLCHPLAF